MEATMFSRRAQFALVALALTISNHANAAALAYGTYYDETLPITSCASASSCRSNFSQLPADKLLMVGKINCTMATSSPVTQVVFEISATSGGTPLQRLLPIAAAPSQL